MIAVQCNTNVTCFHVIILRFEQLCNHKNTSDYISYIADHTFHGHFKLNCLVETETATAATGRASDSTLDKPPGDERRKILKRVKREFVRDMDADAVLLQMAAEDVFNKTGVERIKVNQIQLKKMSSSRRFLPTKGAKAYDIFKEKLQEVHPHLANIILTTTKSVNIKRKLYDYT